MENIIFCLAYLAIVTTMEIMKYYGHTNIDSALLTFAFQLLVLLDEKVKRENNGTGIIRLCINRLRN